MPHTAAPLSSLTGFLLSSLHSCLFLSPSLLNFLLHTWHTTSFITAAALFIRWVSIISSIPSLHIALHPGLDLLASSHHSFSLTFTSFRSLLVTFTHTHARTHAHVCIHPYKHTQVDTIEHSLWPAQCYIRSTPVITSILFVDKFIRPKVISWQPELPGCHDYQVKRNINSISKDFSQMKLCKIFTGSSINYLNQLHLWVPMRPARPYTMRPVRPKLVPWDQLDLSWYHKTS